jgi:hypothetical protein
MSKTEQSSPTHAEPVRLTEYARGGG